MDTYHELLDHDAMYRTLMETEKHVMHSNPGEVFRQLKKDDGAIVDLFLDTLQGPAAAFEDRMRDVLDDLTQQWVHHLIDVELGVD